MKIKIKNDPTDRSTLNLLLPPNTDIQTHFAYRMLVCIIIDLLLWHFSRFCCSCRRRWSPYDLNLMVGYLRINFSCIPWQSRIWLPFHTYFRLSTKNSTTSSCCTFFSIFRISRKVTSALRRALTTKSLTAYRLPFFELHHLQNQGAGVTVVAGPQ